VGGPGLSDEATDGDDRIGEVEVGVDHAFAAFVAALEPVEAVVPGGWVGGAARCLLGKPFSARPPAEPDVMVSRSSGSPVIAA
jgi:hypothetical protein